MIISTAQPDPANAGTAASLTPRPLRRGYRSLLHLLGTIGSCNVCEENVEHDQRALAVVSRWTRRQRALFIYAARRSNLHNHVDLLVGRVHLQPIHHRLIFTECMAQLEHYAGGQLLIEWGGRRVYPPGHWYRKTAHRKSAWIAQDTARVATHLPPATGSDLHTDRLLVRALRSSAGRWMTGRFVLDVAEALGDVIDPQRLHARLDRMAEAGLIEASENSNFSHESRNLDTTCYRLAADVKGGAA